MLFNSAFNHLAHSPPSVLLVIDFCCSHCTFCFNQLFLPHIENKISAKSKENKHDVNKKGNNERLSTKLSSSLWLAGTNSQQWFFAFAGRFAQPERAHDPRLPTKFSLWDPFCIAPSTPSLAFLTLLLAPQRACSLHFLLSTSPRIQLGKGTQTLSFVFLLFSPFLFSYSFTFFLVLCCVFF